MSGFGRAAYFWQNFFLGSSDLNPANGPKNVHRGLLDYATPHSDVSGTANKHYHCVLNDSLGSFKETEEKEEVKNAIFLTFVDIISVSDF